MCLLFTSHYSLERLVPHAHLQGVDVGLFPSTLETDLLFGEHNQSLVKPPRIQCSFGHLHKEQVSSYIWVREVKEAQSELKILLLSFLSAGVKDVCLWLVLRLLPNTQITIQFIKFIAESQLGKTLSMSDPR